MIVHIASQFPPRSCGGLGTHVRGLCEALARRAEVAVVAPEGAATAETRLRRVAAPGDPLDPRAAAAWAEAAARWIEASGGPRGAILHVHNYETALPALAAAERTGARLVVTLHSAAPPRYADLERRLLARADRVIAVSDALRRARAPGAVVVPNGIDPAFHTPGEGTLREPGRLLFAGRLVPEKGPDLALMALAALRAELGRLELRIAGAGPWEQAARNLARRLGVPDCVRWLGWLEPEALRDEMRRCALFLMPSREEPFGLSALEAGACGAPLLAARVGGLPEFLEDGRTARLVPPNDAGALASAAAFLLRDPARAARLGAAAARAARRFSWERAARETLALYAALVPGGIAPSGTR